MKKHYKEREEKVRELLRDKSLDAALFFSMGSENELHSKNAYYLSGFFDVWSHAVLVTDSESLLFTADPERAEKESRIENIIDIRKKKPLSFLRTIKERDIKKVGIDDGIPFTMLSPVRKRASDLRFRDISQDMLKIRSIKDKAEIAKIRQACRITKHALKTVQECLKRGEHELVREIKIAFAKEDADCAFPPIASWDENTSKSHYFGTNKKDGAIVMIDIGARKEKYNADFTRTYLLNGSRDMRKAYEAISQLCGELRDKTECGIKCGELYNYAKQFLEREGYKKQMFCNFHALGHGIGLDVHEWPSICSRAPFKDITLEENMAFTIEPAVYFTGKFGIRIENTFLLSNKGAKIL